MLKVQGIPPAFNSVYANAITIADHVSPVDASTNSPKAAVPADEDIDALIQATKAIIPADEDIDALIQAAKAVVGPVLSIQSTATLPLQGLNNQAWTPATGVNAIPL